MATAITASSIKIREYNGLKLQPKNSNNLSMKNLETSVPTFPADEARRPSVAVRAVATPTPPASLIAKRSKVEIFKEESSYLRYPLLDDLKSPEPNVGSASEQLIKFHGSYMQENRELRKQGVKSWQFMMRTRQPGGKVSNLLYKTMDDMANKYGSGTLRLTTRQTFQLHGILKENMKTVFSTVIRSMGSTLGACGDLNRNILAPAVPYVHRKDYAYCQEYSDKLADLLAPQAGAYYDVWMDGEKVLTSEAPEVTAARLDPQNGATFVGSPEPIYGTQYLPRKFKMAITVPGDNSVDILTNDLGLVVMMNDEGELEGFNLLVGGGMGRTHKTEKTFPAIAQPLGFVPREDIFHAVKAIVATQRDYGRRDDRRQARLKYLIHDWGIDKFRAVVEQYYGKSLQAYRPLPPWRFDPYVGWGAQGDGRLYFGIHVDNGRIKGEAKRAIRYILDKYDLPLRITANQSLILCDIRPSWKSRISKLLAPVGLVGPALLDPLNVSAMACPALPLCGLAIAEAERTLPDILKQIRGILDKVGLKKLSETMVIRMTGCPNGCARPYMAELGFVGDGPNSYQLWIGGSPHQTRLAELFLERVKVQDFEATLEPLFFFWRLKREAGEAFGDFAHREGFAEMKAFMEVYKTPRSYGKVSVRARGGPRVKVERSVYESATLTAKEMGVPVSKFATDALQKYIDEH